MEIIITYIHLYCNIMHLGLGYVRACVRNRVRNWSVLFPTALPPYNITVMYKVGVTLDVHMSQMIINEIIQDLGRTFLRHCLLHYTITLASPFLLPCPS